MTSLSRATRRLTFALSLGALAAAALSVGSLGAQVVGRSESTWTLRERLSSGDRLRLVSPNGAITIAEGGGSDVEIRAEKRADRGARIEDIGFVVRKTARGLTVCAVYDDEDECDAEDGQSRRRNRRNRDGWNSPRASFIVRIPAGVLVKATTGNGDVSITGAGSEVIAHTGNGRVLVSGTGGSVQAHTGNGRITVEDARGPVEATTGNGDVRVATSIGPVTATSGNGDIDVTMDRIERAEAMKFHTGSGRITVALPSGYNADLEASSGNGTISSDLPVRIEGRLSPRRMRGTIGSGGDLMELSTGNGDIEIRKSR